MAHIVNLNELVGEDIVFQYGQPVVDYAIPGDVDVETVFRLFEMFQNVAKIEEDRPEDLSASVKRRFDDITGELLALLRVRQPDLERYPFGIKSTGIVLRHVLGALGVAVEDPQPPAPRRQRRSASVKTKKQASR